tara:strand:- start:4900 stop:6795 length:1896 start_codon:yes stop_codon:yes gene_type:complete
MKVIIIILVLFQSSLFSQVSASDLDRITNNQLDEIKKELQNEPKLDVKKNDVESNAVTILQDNSQPINQEYYGYDYFKSEINFFDNIPTPTEFKLGAGDEIIISLWGETNLREKFIINKEGLIYYENIGFINLSNKTIEEAENLLVVELSKIYSTLNDLNNQTKLMVELGKLKSLNIYFSGEVSKPGIQLVHPFADILTAITQAGGVNNEGSLRNIQLIRKNNIIAVIDFYSFFIEGSNDFSNFRIIDGDTIHIPAINNRVKIEGSVLRPGFYELLPNENVNDLINYAAGLKPNASSIITIDTIIPFSNRKSQNNIVSSINIDLNVNNQTVLNNGDKVLIREAGLSSSKVEIYGRVKVQGEYSAINMTLKDVLDFAGGFDDPIFRKTIVDDEIIILRKDDKQFYSQEIKSSYADADQVNLNIDDKIFVYEKINYRNSSTYRVEGEVNKPGTYPLKKGITVEQALERAGGLTSLSTFDNIVVSKEFTDIDEFDIKSTEIENVANVSLDFELTANSVIKVLPYENVVNVEGNVFNPGLVAFDRGMTMSQAIIQAGGYKPNSLKRRAYVKSANGEVNKASIFLGRVKRLNPGDTVVVPVDPNPDEFDITTFVADLSTTLANIAAILLIVDNQND